MSILSAIGKDVKGLLSWLGSPKGQAVVNAGEELVEDAFPAATGAINLANTWLVEIFKAEALGEAAGTATGTDTQKAAAVIASVTPSVLTFAKTQGLGTPTAANLQSANDALVTFLEALGAEPAKA